MELETDIVVGERLRLLRSGKGMTLDDLAARSGVSRAMISRIERGQASPTAQLLARLCGALGQSLSSFFAADDIASPMARRADQRLWRDPATGYHRRAVSPPGNPTPVDVVEVAFPPGAMVSFPPPPVDDGTTQHVWLLEGRLTMTIGEATHAMEPGDCLFMALGGGHVFHNPHGEPARYAVILNRNKP